MIIIIFITLKQLTLKKILSKSLYLATKYTRICFIVKNNNNSTNNKLLKIKMIIKIIIILYQVCSKMSHIIL